MFRLSLIASLALALLLTPAAIAPAHAAPGGFKPGPTPDQGPAFPFLTRDLYVSSIHVIEGSGDVIQSPKAIVTIRNFGYQYSGPFWLRIYTLVDGKWLYSLFYVPNLGAMQSKTFTAKMKKASYSPSNYYYVHVTVDYTHMVSESNESNNDCAAMVFVVPRPRRIPRAT